MALLKIKDDNGNWQGQGNIGVFSSSGGEETWELIKSGTTTEASPNITINKDNDGNDFSLKHFKFILYNYSGSNFSPGSYSCMRLNNLHWMQQLCSNGTTMISNDNSVSFSFRKINTTVHEFMCDGKLHYRIDGEKGANAGIYSHIDSVTSIIYTTGAGASIPAGMKYFLFGVKAE